MCHNLMAGLGSKGWVLWSVSSWQMYAKVNPVAGDLVLLVASQHSE